MGACFILINNKVNSWRKKLLKNKWLKLAECVLLCFVTVTTMYLATYIKFKSSDNPLTDDSICDTFKTVDKNLTNLNGNQTIPDHKHTETRQFLCNPEYFDRLATLMFDT